MRTTNPSADEQQIDLVHLPASLGFLLDRDKAGGMSE